MSTTIIINNKVQRILRFELDECDVYSDSDTWRQKKILTDSRYGNK